MFLNRKKRHKIPKGRCGMNIFLNCICKVRQNKKHNITPAQTEQN